MRPPGELAPEIINILFDGLITRETDESSTAPKVHKKRSQK
jgi:hypothetical protein